MLTTHRYITKSLCSVKGSNRATKTPGVSQEKLDISKRK